MKNVPMSEGVGIILNEPLIKETKLGNAVFPDSTALIVTAAPSGSYIVGKV